MISSPEKRPSVPLYVIEVVEQDSNLRGKGAAPSKGRRRKKKAKRGRPKKKAWSLRSQFLRRHSHKFLRRTQVDNLIAADNFAVRKGQPLKVFISIRWDHTQEGENNIRQRWVALSNALRIWASRHGIVLHAITVHENPVRLTPCFNTHILANIPVQLHEKLTKWLRKQLGGELEAVDVRPRASTDWLKDKTLRYMLKGADPQTAKRYGIRYAPQGNVAFRRCAMTRNLNVRSREAWKQAGIAQVSRAANKTAA